MALFTLALILTIALWAASYWACLKLSSATRRSFARGDKRDGWIYAGFCLVFLALSVTILVVGTNALADLWRSIP